MNLLTPDPSHLTPPQQIETAKLLAEKLQMEVDVRGELRRHFLSERERLVADALLEISLGWGLDAVCIPKLDVIGDLTGLNRSHVHGALRGLHDMRILQIDSAEGGLTRYAFNTNSENWKVKIRIARATVKAAKDLLLEVNHMAKPPEFADELLLGILKPVMAVAVPVAAPEPNSNGVPARAEFPELR